MDWANVIKIHTPPICQTLFSPLTSMRCTTIISRPEIANYRGSLVYNICLISISNSVSNGATNKSVLNIDRS